MRLDSCRRIARLLWTSEDGDLLLGDSSDLPLLSLPLLPIPVADVSGPVSAVTPSVGEPVLVPSVMPPQEGPFDVDQTVSGLGDTPRVLDGLPGCQYRMTSYDSADRPDLDPAYGLHLHDPRFLEYVGAPESARLLSRAPDYWLHHMTRDQAISAALQLQRDEFAGARPVCDITESEVMRLAFGHEPYPSEAVQSVAPSPCVRRAAHYMAAMGLWVPGCSWASADLILQCCMMCADCFPDL